MAHNRDFPLAPTFGDDKKKKKKKNGKKVYGITPGMSAEEKRNYLKKLSGYKKQRAKINYTSSPIGSGMKRGVIKKNNPNKRDRGWGGAGASW
jgi:hypothetical protein|tara:strand:- start:254 stop:532 length:279 start_codon:yes stop_codon:yes gene_type:complete